MPSKKPKGPSAEQRLHEAIVTLNSALNVCMEPLTMDDVFEALKDRFSTQECEELIKLLQDHVSRI